ncbi:MAG: hypothetical protein Tsb0019_21410 [Roseibium sp.]
MFRKVSKVSAPIAGAILLVAAGMATTASAAPLPADLQVRSTQSEPVVKIDHRQGRHGHKAQRRHDGFRDHGRHGWNRGWGHHELGPREIRRSLRHRGFHRIDILDRRGPVYIVKARAWGGQKLRLVVDSRSGQIVRSHPIGHRPHWQGPWY